MRLGTLVGERGDRPCVIVGGEVIARTPPTWLVAGDVVRIEIDGIGHIEDAVVEEPQAVAAAGELSAARG